MGPRHLVWPFGTVGPVVREPAHRAFKIAGGQIAASLDAGKSLPIPKHASGDPGKRNPAIPAFGLDGHRIEVRDMKQFVSERHHAGHINREISRLSRDDGIFPVRSTRASSGKFPNMTNLADRIQNRLDALNLKPAVVAREAGLKPDYVRDVLRGSKKSISAEHAAALARILQCNLNWLVTGEHGHMSSEEVASTFLAEDPREHLGASSLEKYLGKVPGAIPEIDAKAGAGNGNVGEHEVVTIRRGEAFVGHKVVSEWVFPSTFLRHELRMQPGEIMVLEVVGDSMSPSLESGDRVLVDTTYAKPTPDGIYVIEEGDGPMVKRLQLVRRSDPPEIRIISDNKHHEPYTLRLDDIRIIGRVSGRVTKM